MQAQVKIDDQQNKSTTTGINSNDQNDDDKTIYKKTSNTANNKQHVIDLITSLLKLVTTQPINPMKATDAFFVCHKK